MGWVGGLFRGDPAGRRSDGWVGLCGSAFFAHVACDEEEGEREEDGDDCGGDEKGEGGGGEGSKEFSDGDDGVEETGGCQGGDASGEGFSEVKGGCCSAACDDGEGPAQPVVHADDEGGGEEGTCYEGGWGTDHVECVVDGGDVIGEQFGEGGHAEERDGWPGAEPGEILGELDDAAACGDGGDEQGDEDAKPCCGAECDSGDEAGSDGGEFVGGGVHAVGLVV